MKKTIVIGLALLVSTGLLMAAPTTCASSTTLSALIALTSTGCLDAGGDVLFSNFTYTDNTGGTVPAADIAATLIAAPLTNGWTFTPGSGTPGIWGTGGFDLTFTVTITAGHPLESFIGSQDQFEAGAVPNAVTVVDAQTYGTINLNGLTTGAETMQISDPNVQSININTVAAVPSSFISSYSLEFFDTTAPEPATLGLLGLGLLGLGYLARRRKHS
jgi:hypothetical protein